MRRSASRRFTILIVAIAAVVVYAIARSGGDPQSGVLHNALLVRIGSAPLSRLIPSGFVGLSFEYSALPAYAGHDPASVDPVLVRLIRNMNPGQSPVLRIGGDSTDRTWWPIPGIARPAGIRYSLTRRWISVAGSLARALDARLVPSLNMEANSRTLTSGEAQALVTGIGTKWTGALEPGNEPELYGLFAWYHANGHKVTGRPRSYSPADFAHEFSQVASSLPHVPLAGPSTGAPKWMGYLGQFVAAERGLALVTLHRYPLRGCFVGPRSREYASIKNLLSSAATRGLAASIAPYTRLPLPVRIDEINSVNCGGVSGVSDTFASALWALDALFEMARVGVAGLNFHTFPGARYAPFDLRRVDGTWRGAVKPIYYGMLMFAQAASPGSRLLQGSGSAGKGINVWALRAPDGQLRVVLINYGTSGARTVAVRLPVGSGVGTIERLQAPSVRAKDGVTIGGRGFGSQTRTGVLSGSPRVVSVKRIGGDYVIRLPAASAALLTVGG